MKKIVLILIIASFLLVNISTVFGCSCVLPKASSEALKEATAVFAGKVVGIDAPSGLVISSADPVKVTFNVSKVWKGPTYKTLVITTARNGASCGYSFKEGEDYVVYAYGKETELSTGLCSRTKLLSNAEEDLKELGYSVAPNSEGVKSPVTSSLIQISLFASGIILSLVVVLLINKKYRK